MIQSERSFDDVTSYMNSLVMIYIISTPHPLPSLSEKPGKPTKTQTTVMFSVVTLLMPSLAIVNIYGSCYVDNTLKHLNLKTFHTE